MQTLENQMKNEKPLEFYEHFWPDFKGEELTYEQNTDKALDLDSQNLPLSKDLEFQLSCCYTSRHFREFAENYNNIEDNKKQLRFFQTEVNKLRSRDKFSTYFAGVLKKIELLNDYIDSYLITTQLEFLFDYLNDIKRVWKIAQEPEEIDFTGFEFTEEEVFERIRKNSKWHHVERDISIYQEKPFYTLRELAKRYGIKYNSISMVVNKVQGTISEIIGNEFEKFILKKLRESKLFEKVERMGGTGEPDILAYKNDSELYIYSLKCLKLESSPYWLIKNELRPELEYAKLTSADYKNHLILLVFDSFNQKIIQLQMDYNNPENIELTQFLDKLNDDE